MEVLRVQTIASESKDAVIPAMFVRPETEQPGITTVHGVKLGVPIIDFSNLDEGKVMREIMEASRDWGMFQIVNHEIPSQVISKLQTVGKEFFDLPQEEKELYAMPAGSDSIEGYGTKLQKEVNDKKGWVDHLFHIIWPPSAIHYRFWPKNPPSYSTNNLLEAGWCGSRSSGLSLKGEWGGSVALSHSQGDDLTSAYAIEQMRLMAEREEYIWFPRNLSPSVLGL
ncbi:flavonol synthase/flavanone 3-hydroxylase-like [Gastrolobium bilobum]|uniref:flavonol synthase/flavanone 3-hydroxylase-like n=1 Tax=Gastrolobium bilobum TaxID=150636 RepID=UPI002AB2F47A|nr:flavonol synthase/flavanone 3-hydroxylase-like [Gastrolobium bilobum]